MTTTYTTAILMRGTQKFRTVEIPNDRDGFAPLEYLLQHIQLPKTQKPYELGDLVECFREVFKRAPIWPCPHCHAVIYNSENYMQGPKWFYDTAEKST
jgi:hypothetical protein